MEIRVDHITRVEGHGNILASLEDGRVKQAFFQVVEAAKAVQPIIDERSALARQEKRLEDDAITRTDTRVRVKARAGEGVGIVEAPRGTLIHRYVLTRTGKLKEIRLTIPTQVNNAAINMSVKAAASRYIANGKVDPGLLNGVEMLIRAYDPCIKCATRTAGSGIDVEIRGSDGELVKSISS